MHGPFLTPQKSGDEKVLTNLGMQRGEKSKKPEEGVFSHSALVWPCRIDVANSGEYSMALSSNSTWSIYIITKVQNVSDWNSAPGKIYTSARASLFPATKSASGVFAEDLCVKCI